MTQTAHDLLTEQYLTNLRLVVAQASPMDIEDGMSWYDDARVFSNSLASTLDPQVWSERRARAAGVIAVLSPRQSWVNNKKYAALCFEYARCGIADLILELPVFSANAAKALALLDPEVPVSTDREDSLIRGPKVRAFFKNIMGDPDALTLDTHAINACRGEFVATPKHPHPAARTAMCEAYTMLGHELGCTPSQAQAVVWVTWRHIKNPNHTHG